MSEDDAPKSAFELAMARLRRKDAETGEGIRALTNAQREEIAEVRRVYEAKMAEADIMQRPKIPEGLPAELQDQVDVLNEQFLRERDRLAAERDQKIEEIKNRPAET